MKKVISNNSLPPKLPVLHTIVSLLALDYWNATTIVWVIVITILTLSWIISLLKIVSTNKYIDIMQYWHADDREKARDILKNGLSDN